MKAETNDIFLPQTILETRAEKEIELECTLADYLPNISRIIRVDAQLTKDGISVMGEKAELNGKAVFLLLYESDYKGKVRSVSFPTDFTQRFDIKGAGADELFPSASLRVAYVSCKTLNPRRFILKCRAETELEVRAMRGAKVAAISDEDGFFYRSREIGVQEIKSVLERDFTLEESVSVDSLPSVGEIISNSMSFSPPEISVASGAAIFRCEATFKCLYEAEGEDEGCVVIERRFPVSLTLERDDLEEGALTFGALELRSLEVSGDIDAYGENRIIDLTYSVRASLDVIAEREVSFPTDMFTEHYVNRNSFSDIVVESVSKPERHSFVLERVFEIPNMLIEKCLDCSADLSVSEATVGEDGVAIKGVCGLSVFGTDGENYDAVDHSVSFTENFRIPSLDEGSRAKVRAYPVSVSAEIAGKGRLSVRINAEAYVSVTKKRSEEVLASVELERLSGDDDDEPVIICYPRKNDALWDIAKKYRVDPSKLLAKNEAAFGDKELIGAEDAILII